MGIHLFSAKQQRFLQTGASIITQFTKKEEAKQEDDDDESEGETVGEVVKASTIPRIGPPAPKVSPEPEAAESAAADGSGSSQDEVAELADASAVHEQAGAGNE